MFGVRGIFDKVIVKCQQCGKEFNTKPYKIKMGLSKYCSRKCYSETRNKKVIKICEHCGKEIIVLNCYAKRNQYKYCSRKCYRSEPSIMKGKIRIGKIDVKCVHCEKIFKDYASSKRKYCSIECFNLAPKKNTKIKRTCKYCGKEFKIKISRIKKGVGKYCSHSCSGLARNQKGKNSPRWKGGYKALYERLKNNPQYILSNRMSCLMYYDLRKNKNGKTWQDLVPYDYKQAKRRLKSTMPIGFCWQDFLDGKLHIDHIIPRSVFNFTKPEHIDFQRCWALSNLQLLPAKENLSKHNKLSQAFQPSLMLET